MTNFIKMYDISLKQQILANENTTNLFSDWFFNMAAGQLRPVTQYLWQSIMRGWRIKPNHKILLIRNDNCAHDHSIFTSRSDRYHLELLV